MLKKSLVSFAIIVSGLFLANSAYGQSSSSTNGTTAPQVVRTRQTNSLLQFEIQMVRNRTMNTEDRLGNFEIQRVRGNSGNGQNRLGNFEIQDVRSNGRVRGLIDTSTGEIVW